MRTRWVEAMPGGLWGGELAAISLLERGDERSDIAVDRDRRSQPDPVAQREIRLLQQRPAFAEKARIAVDEHRLDRGTGALGDQRKAALERVDAGPAGARPFRKDQQLPAGPQLPNPFFDEMSRRVIADEPGKSGTAAQQTARQQPGFRGAHHAGQPGDDEDHVEQARMVRCDDQRRLAAQRVQRGEIAFYDAAQLHQADEIAKSGHDHELADPRTDGTRRDRMEEGCGGTPDQAAEGEDREKAVEDEVLVTTPQQKKMAPRTARRIGGHTT